MALPVAASGSRVQWWRAVEDANGDISATTPDFFPIRFNTSDLTRDTAQVESNEINPNRQRVKARQGTYSLAGSIVQELTFGTPDYLMQAVLQSTWQTRPTITAGTISAAASDNSYNDSGNGFLAAGFVPGLLVQVTGFTGDVANNITDGKIVSVTAGKMIIASPKGDAIVDDAAGESVTIQTAGDYLMVGSTVPTAALLRRNLDTGVDMIYRHCRYAGLSLSAVLNRSAEITVPIVGELAEEYTVPGGATFNAATSSDMMVPTIGYMHEAHSALTYLTDYNFELNNNMEALFSLFQRSAYSVSNGRFTASGTMTAYQPDGTLLAKFVNETESHHIVRLQDLDGSWYRFIFPDLVYSQLSDPVQGEGAHLHNYSFGPGYDGNTTIMIERST